MIRAAVDQGTTTICLTPHLLEYKQTIVDLTRELHRQVSELVRQEGMDVRLLLGFEVDLSVAATVDMETLRTLSIEDGDGQPGRAILVETPYNNWPPFFEETIYRLSTGGMIPIIAHPERNGRVQRSPDVLMGCLNAGAVLQGTSGSLSPSFRKSSQKTFFELLSRGWFSLLGSDAHVRPQYTWTLAPLLEELEKRCTPEYRDLLVHFNPLKVLQGERPARTEPERARKRFGLF
jgi:protein-tyrosine phosphatase